MHYNIVNNTSKTLATRLGELAQRVKSLADIAVTDLNVRGMGTVVLHGDDADSVYDRAPDLEFSPEEYTDDKGEVVVIPGRLVGAVTRAMWTIAMGKYPVHNESQVLYLNEGMVDVLKQTPVDVDGASVGELACWDVRRNRLGDVIGRCQTKSFMQIDATQGMSADNGYRVKVTGLHGLRDYGYITLMVRDTQAIGSVMFQIHGLLVKAPTDPSVTSFGINLPYAMLDHLVIHVKNVGLLNMFFRVSHDPHVVHAGGQTNVAKQPCMVSSLARHGDPDTGFKIPGMPVMRATVAGPSALRMYCERAVALVYGSVLLTSAVPINFSWIVPGGKARTFMYMQYRAVDDADDVDAVVHGIHTWLNGDVVNNDTMRAVMGTAPVTGVAIHTRDGATKASYTTTCMGAYWPVVPNDGPFNTQSGDAAGGNWDGVGTLLDRHADVLPMLPIPSKL